MMKHVIYASLMIVVYVPITAQECAYFLSPAFRYNSLGSDCKPKKLVIPQGPHHQAIKEHLEKNNAWLKEKTNFFLKHKHLKLVEIEERWQKLQSDENLKKKYTELQEWLAQKAREPLPSVQREGAVPKPGWHS